MSLSATSAWVFLPFVLPICLYVAFTDLREMRITNQAVLALAAVFVVIGPFALPLSDYGWGFVHLLVVLLIGILLNAAGAVGAGDAKFAAAAAPFIALGDLRLLMGVFAANILAAFVTHRLAKYSALRRIAPGWQSWDKGWDFPMGLSLGGTLAIYLILATIHGQ